MLVLPLTLLSSCYWMLTAAIPIDNGLVDDPVINCQVDNIDVVFRTRNPFIGHVYVKGFYSDPICRTDAQDSNSQAEIRIRLDTCGVGRLRSVNPAGLYQTVTVVVTFHPFFITKVDRAFNIQCFYTETTKFLTQLIDVSMLSTEVKVANAPMPVCRYEVLNVEQSYGPHMAPVRFARVGQPVLHKWMCETDTPDTYCMTVHSCIVDDGTGNSVKLVDEAGCAVDRYLLGNLEYPTDMMSQRESHVFKYADKTQVYFQCQISVALKGDIQHCPLPNCVDSGRGKRSDTPLTIAGTMDVRKDLSVFEVDTTDTESTQNSTERPTWLTSESSLALLFFFSLCLILCTLTCFIRESVKRNQAKSLNIVR